MITLPAAGDPEPSPTRASRWIGGRKRVVGLLLAASTVLVGWVTRFRQDDAYISFRYARNLAEGEGLVYNPGERIEGYTNFLWTVVLAIPHRLGWDVVTVAHVLAIGAGVVTVVGTWVLADRLLGRDDLALAAAAGLLLVHPFVVYLTGGLETQWQTALVVSTACAVLGRAPHLPGPARLVAGSLLGAAACLTRMDSLLLVGPILLAGWAPWRPDRRTPELPSGALLPAGAVLGTWVWWKLAYYGAVLPNTASAKTTSLSEAVPRGILYLLMFLLLSGLVVALPLVARSAPSLWANAGLRLLAVVVGLWSAYLVVVGGDFMDFRFLVPVLPFVSIWVVASLPGAERWQVIALAVVVVSASVLKATLVGELGAVEMASQLEARVAGPDGWEAAGRALGVLAQPDGGGPLIAVTAAGALPYVSDLPTLDLLGLTDRRPASAEWPAIRKPGHERIATLPYVLERGTDLLVGHPQVRRCDSVRADDAAELVSAMYFELPVPLDLLPATSRLVEIPLESGDDCLVAFDLGGEARWSEAVDAQGWRTIPVP